MGQGTGEGGEKTECPGSRLKRWAGHIGREFYYLKGFGFGLGDNREALWDVIRTVSKREIRAARFRRPHPSDWGPQKLLP